MAAGWLAAAGLLLLAGSAFEFDNLAPIRSDAIDVEVAQQHPRTDLNQPSERIVDPDDAPQVLPDAPESGIVMTSGSVRLVLLTNMEDPFLDHPDSGNSTDFNGGPNQEN